MTKNIKISASLSCIDLLNVESEIKKINQSKIDFIHYDVVDGRFNNTFILGDLLLSHVRKITELPIEVHLAVENPELYLAPFIKAGADYIAVHIESIKDNKVLKQIARLGAKPILAYKAETAPSLNDLPLLENCCGVLKLTVEPGYSGQKFQKRTLKHIRDLKSIIEEHNLNLEIQADGNINVDTILDVTKSGATILTGGSSGVFKKDTIIDENIEELTNVINNNC